MPARGAHLNRPARPITPREDEILALMLEGYDNAAIADALGITVPTAKRHISNLFAKRGVCTRTELFVQHMDCEIENRLESRVETRLAQMKQQLARVPELERRIVRLNALLAEKMLGPLPQSPE